jgi:hypothetical protein
MLRSGFWFGSGLRQRTADSFSKRWTLKGALLAGALRSAPTHRESSSVMRRRAVIRVSSLPQYQILVRRQGPRRTLARQQKPTLGPTQTLIKACRQRIIATQGSAVKATSRPTLFLLASNQPSRTSPLSSAGDRPLNLVRLSSFR